MNMINKKANDSWHHGKKKSSICFVAGRSGGHIVPCLTLAQQYKEQHPDAHVLFFCSTKPIDATVMRQQGAHITTITYLPLIQITSRSPRTLMRFAWSCMQSFIMSFCQLYKLRPEFVTTTGSDVAIPVVLAAYILRIKIKLCEVNAVPGKSTKLLAGCANEIAICFAQTAHYFPRYTCTIEPYPLRFKNTQKRELSSLRTYKTILILGGSQGSHFINTLIQDLFMQYPDLKQHVTVIHQYGNDTRIAWDNWYNDHGIRAKTYNYTNNLEELYQQADLVICRAGAGSLFETLAYHIPMICIPLETQQTDHQLDNARACAQEHPDLCYMIRQQELILPEKLYTTLQALLSLPANSSAAHQE